jgi:energy-coupling factor transport system ATP-binding protein
MIPIILNSVSFTYPGNITALHDVSLQIEPGESVALIGPNGAGKTTLARHLNGLLLPTSGTVAIGDHDTRTQTVAQLAHRVGYVFQHPEHQIFKRKVRDEIAVGPRNLGFTPSRVAEVVEQALHVTGLMAFADHHPHDLMPALRKRVALASILAMEPPIMVLDEPTTGQDAFGLGLISQIVRELDAAGRTVIIISHDIDFCADHCRRLIVLNAGRVLLDGPPATVFGHRDALVQSAVELPQLTRLAERLALPLVWQIEPLLDALEDRRSGAAGA